MPLVRATVALLALAVVIGCGGDEPTAVVRDQEVAITLDDFLIRPQNVEVDIPVGRVPFEIVNRGRLRHSFRLWGSNRAPIEVETIFPGQTVHESAYIAAGEYRMVCTVSNHAELGMTGRLVVR